MRNSPNAHTERFYYRKAVSELRLFERAVYEELERKFNSVLVVRERIKENIKFKRLVSLEAQAFRMLYPLSERRARQFLFVTFSLLPKKK